jgi:predicted ATPase
MTVREKLRELGRLTPVTARERRGLLALAMEQEFPFLTKRKSADRERAGELCELAKTKTVAELDVILKEWCDSGATSTT